LNPKCRIARYIALVAGALLCGIGILHDIVNIRSVTRAIARGEIVERMGAQLVANVALAGLALVLLGLFLLLVASDLEKGKRLAWRVAFVVGIFLICTGLAGYWWQAIPRVLIFSAVGVVLTGPLLLWRKHFSAE
jgi:protein-S-isoprenylcysteine O-methyltransferase Ste14